MQKEQKIQGRLIAADFLTHTLRALGIGLAAALVLGGAVLLLAQSGSTDEAAVSNAGTDINTKQ